MGSGSLCLGVARGNLKIIKMLLRAGACLEKQSVGYTPLMQAVCSGNLKIARLLLEIGANVNAISSDGKTAL